MRFRVPRKIHFLIVTAVVGINIVCFFTLSHVTLYRIGVANLARQVGLFDNSTSLRSYLSTSPSSAATTMTTFSPKKKVKIDTIKHYLNESADPIIPAFRIGRYLMADTTMCKGVDTVDVIILVHTAPRNLEKRQRMRDSFANASLFFPFHVRIAFLLGRTKDASLQSRLLKEHTTHNDTVMGDFIDAYHNLTLKGVMGYRWVSQYCPNSKYVLKIDDDVIVNMYKLLYSFSGHMNGKKKSIFCNVWSKDTMTILRTGKWKVSNHAFSKLTRFPYDYCSGFVVLFTSDLMKPLYDAAKMTPFFWIDDIYLFGMLPKVVGGVTFYNYALDNILTLNDQTAIKCIQTHGHRCQILATLISPSKYWSYWKMIKDIYSLPSWNVEHRLVD